MVNWNFHHVEEEFSSWNKDTEERKEKKNYTKEPKQKRIFPFYTNHTASLPFATGNSEHFLNSQIFLIS